MNELRPNEQRGKTAITLIWLVMIIDTLGIIVSIIQLSIYSMMESGEYVSEYYSLGGDLLQGVFGLLSLSMSIVSIITFIRWFRRAYYNLGTLTHNMEYQDVWAAGAWFVPIMNLFVPYKMMKEMYRKTEQYLILELNHPNNTNLSTNHVTGWWTLWIIGGIIGNLMMRVVLREETLTNLKDGEILSIISSIIGIPLAILTVYVIKNYSEAEKTLYDIQQEGSETEKEESLSY